MHASVWDCGSSIIDRIFSGIDFPREEENQNINIKLETIKEYHE